MKALAAITPLLSGALFGSGLLLSGMTNPQVVLGFLDVAGHWNPALAFTMAGAIAVAAPALWWARRRKTMTLPTTLIDVRLIGGAALFGIGWGLSGICPGPGLVLLASGAASAWVFVLAMAAGQLLAGVRTRIER